MADPDVYVNQISCASDGNCVAVGSYLDSSGDREGLILDESSSTWDSGVAVALPANSATPTEVELDAVSCPSVGNCSALGTYLDTSGNYQGLLVNEVSGAWQTGTEAPLPAGAQASQNVHTLSISCASVGNCTAVGWYDVPSSTQGLLLTETSGTWSAAEAPVPIGANTPPSAGIYSVSCPAADGCAAVGLYTDAAGNAQGELLTESSGTWSAITAPLPTGAGTNPEVDLGSGALSCPELGQCSVIGVYVDGSGYRQGLLLDQGGGGWTPTEAPLPANADSEPFVSVGSISCASSGNCSAVSSYSTSGHYQGLLLTESAGTWGPGIEATLPTGGQNPNLDSVSCTSAGNCSAVGSYFDSTGDNTRGVLVTQTSGTWASGAEASPPANAGANAEVHVGSVSCPGAGSCSAVGSYNDANGEHLGLELAESGGSWAAGTEAALPTQAGLPWGARLSSVSCPAAGACVAAGSAVDGSGGNQLALLAVPSGSGWSTVLPQLPANSFSGFQDGQLSSISCASAGNCTAVGRYTVGNFEIAGLLVTEAGGSWQPGVQAPRTADNSNGNAMILSSVSCAAAGDCVAVGWYFDNSDHRQGLVLTQSSGSWTAATTPLPVGGTATDPKVELLSVSCPSVGNCSAVGFYTDGSKNQQGLLLSEGSGSWSATEASLPGTPAANPNASLSSVSCASAGACEAVGSYTDSSGNTQGLLLAESGGAWGTGTEAPLPSGASGNPGVSIRAVSCPSAGDCSAVGSYLDSSGNGQGLLLSQASGTWSATEASLPADAPANPAVVLQSVACPASGSCAAAGLDGDPAGLLFTEGSGTWEAGIDAPLPAGTSPDVSLASVACPSTGGCASVGYYRAGGSNGASIDDGLIETLGATAANDGTTVSAAGVGSFAVAQYASDPQAPPTFTSAGQYFDVHVDPGNTFSSLTITDCNLAGGNGLQWWNPTGGDGAGAWQPVVGDPGPTYTPGNPPCLSVVLDTASSPTLAQLTGTVFAVSSSSAPAGGSAGGSGAGSTIAGPTVTAISPAVGPTTGATAVTITGTGFSTAPAGTQFSFGPANPATGVSCSSTTSCSATTPPGAGTVDVIATSSGLSSSPNPPGDQFTYQSAPPTPAASGPCASAGVAQPSADQVYVCRLYEDLLGRGADPQGLATWTKLLGAGAPRVSVPMGMTSSAEYRGKFVASLYETYLDRAPDRQGLATYTGQLAAGIQDAVIQAELLGSPEYFGVHGSTDGGWLDGIYHDLFGRAVDPNGQATWGATLAGGRSRQQVATQLLASGEYRADLVGFYYQRFLHRTPTITEVDGWLSRIETGAADEQVIAGITSSPEYVGAA